MLKVRQASLPLEEAALFELNLLISPDESRERFREDLKRAEGAVLVVTDQDQIVGFTSFSYPWWNDIAIGIHFAVNPQHRGKGAGSLLMKAALEASRNSGCRFFTIQTAKWNSGAIKLYERLGFTVQATFQDYFGQANDMVWLHKDLRP